MAYIFRSCPICGRVHPYSERCAKKKRRSENRDEDIKMFRGSKEWKRKREFIKQRDLYMCAVCASKGELSADDITTEGLSVHHIVSLSEDFNKRLDDDNLVTLCSYHHKMAEKGEIKREELEKIINPPG